jgi:hypothetical protein
MKCGALCVMLILGTASLAPATDKSTGYIWQASAVADACEDADAQARRSETQMMNAGLCVGFISAVEDYLEDSGYELLDRKNDSRASKVFTAYLVLHPNLNSSSARSVMTLAWLEAGVIRHSKAAKAGD